jgi:hypothetical protein
VEQPFFLRKRRSGEDHSSPKVSPHALEELQGEPTCMTAYAAVSVNPVLHFLSKEEGVLICKELMDKTYSYWERR